MCKNSVTDKSACANYSVLAISPLGHLHIISFQDKNGVSQLIHNRQIIEAFKTSQAEGLLKLAAARSTNLWPSSLIYWREFVGHYLKILCNLATATETLSTSSIPPLLDDELNSLVLNIPPMPGAEYCSLYVLKAIWYDFDSFIRNKIEKNPGGISSFLSEYLPLWHQVGRVCFHLAENKQNEDYPFAFLATYACVLGKNTRIQYLWSLFDFSITRTFRYNNHIR